MTYKKSFTVEVRNGFKYGSIDISVDRVPEELWVKRFITFYRRQ